MFTQNVIAITEIPLAQFIASDATRLASSELPMRKDTWQTWLIISCRFTKHNNVWKQKRLNSSDLTILCQGHPAQTPCSGRVTTHTPESWSRTWGRPSRALRRTSARRFSGCWRRCRSLSRGRSRKASPAGRSIHRHAGNRFTICGMNTFKGHWNRWYFYAPNLPQIRAGFCRKPPTLP